MHSVWWLGWVGAGAASGFAATFLAATEAFPLNNAVTKYGEEMTDALFPFIKRGATTVCPASAHAALRAQTRWSCVRCVYFEPILLILLW